MSGADNVRFADLFADTVKVHGLQFAHQHYVRKHGMAAWEFRFWARATLL